MTRALALDAGPEAPASARASVGERVVYAVGDVHGRYDLLRLLLEEIASDMRRPAGSGPPMLLFLGDYVDRGPASDRVLEALVWMKSRPDFEVRTLKGNHEQALLAFLEDPLSGEPWLRYGGDATLRAYGVEPPDPAGGPEAFARARDQFLGRLPASHLRLLERLELLLVIGDYAFAHAGVRPGLPLADQAEGDLLSIRAPFLSAEDRFEKVIVHGHSWRGDQPELRANRIGLDTGAYKTGVLTAARLHREDVRILQARV